MTRYRVFVVSGWEAAARRLVARLLGGLSVEEPAKVVETREEAAREMVRVMLSEPPDTRR